MFALQHNHTLAHNADDIRRTADKIALQSKIQQPTNITQNPHKHDFLLVFHLENHKLQENGHNADGIK